MKIAVCVKYVPVVAQMGFDYATKTILREGVPSEITPFDRLGLLCAIGLKAGPADEVLAMSMGPPQAREGLRTLGPDHGTGHLGPLRSTPRLAVVD